MRPARNGQAGSCSRSANSVRSARMVCLLCCLSGSLATSRAAVRDTASQLCSVMWPHPCSMADSRASSPRSSAKDCILSGSSRWRAYAASVSAVTPVRSSSTAKPVWAWLGLAAAAPSPPRGTAA